MKQNRYIFSEIVEEKKFKSLYDTSASKNSKEFSMKLSIT